MALEKKIDELREILSETGGDLELVEFNTEKKTACIRLKGTCAYCPFSRITMTEIIERKLLEVPGIEKVAFRESVY
jgi:Thioredoxin-like proteins and domains